MPSSAASGATTSMKPPETSATEKPSRCSVRTRVRAPGVSRTAARTSSSTVAGSPARQRDPLVQALREVQLAAHRPLGDRRDLLGRPACAASSSITSSWISVESTSMTTSRAPAAGQAGGGDGDVDPAGGRLERELAAQPVDVLAPETSSSRVLTG